MFNWELIRILDLVSAGVLLVGINLLKSIYINKV